MTRIPKTHEDLENQLAEQIELLKELVKLYDSGKTVVAKSIASSIRVLVHQSPTSHALLEQMGILGQDFYDTAQLRADHNGGIWSGSYSALLGIAIGSNHSGYVPNLDSDKDVRWVPFQKYWNEIIFVDQENNSFTRKDIVLAVANQDGGSHVDPGLDPKYEKLSRNNSLGWITGGDGSWGGLKGAELASVRQIAHELLKTLDTSYTPPTQLSSDGIIVGGVGIVLHTEPVHEAPRRKGPCPCGSGKKYKRCHGN